VENDSHRPPEGIDLPLVAIIPIRKRTVPKRGYEKLKANIKALGLIDPLCVCRDDEKYYLLDGYIRYQILLELGIAEAPCLVQDRRDFYTPNRQVNNLSRMEEGKMIRNALGKLDEKTIARHFGLKSIQPKARVCQKDLHPDTLVALEKGEINRPCARELAFVVPARQAELLEIMRQAGDKSAAFVKTQILKTPPHQRSKRKGRKKTPWERESRNKSELADRLAEINRHFGFFKELFNTYSADLMRLVIHVRDILEDRPLHDWLKVNEPSAYRLFTDTVTERMPPRPPRRAKIA
jgi:hypothetical protein